MANKVWDELGIARTDDVIAIRRAYAARLKMIDADREPDAFMRLRQAYEDALDDAVPEASDEDEPFVLTAGRPAAPPAFVSAERDEAERNAREPYAALAPFRVTFAEFVEHRETRSAAAALERALAQGTVPLGSEAEFIEVLAQCALADDTLSPAELEAMGRAFGGDRSPRFNDPTSDIAREMRGPAEAMRWFARIESDAARGDGVFGIFARCLRRRTRVARAVLIAKDHNLLSSDLPLLRIEARNARRNARWIANRIDPDVLEEKLLKLERTLRGQEILAVLLGIVILGLLFVARVVHR